jgi:hypothetical protein
MTPQKATMTACVHFRDSYPIDVSHLSFNILSAVTLGIYLCGQGPIAGLSKKRVYSKRVWACGLCTNRRPKEPSLRLTGHHFLRCPPIYCAEYLRLWNVTSIEKGNS